MKTKKCSKCGAEKPLDDFGFLALRKSGKNPMCKKCSVERTRQYTRTKKGLVSRIYHNQRHNSKRRNHPMPDYTRCELMDWIFSQKLFHDLYNEWVDTGYDRHSTPSCDRLCNSSPYTLGNIQLVKFLENEENARRDLVNGTLITSQMRAVISINKITGETKEYFSIHEADRQTRADFRNISACCLGKIKSCGGYFWKFKDTKICL